MTGTFISSTSFINSARSNWNQIRSEISKANVEISTGRLADAGVTLGARSGQGLSIRREDAALQALGDDDATLSSQLDQSQAALQTMSKDANGFLQSLVSLPQGGGDSVTADPSGRIHRRQEGPTHKYIGSVHRQTRSDGTTTTRGRASSSTADENSTQIATSGEIAVAAMQSRFVT